MSTLCVICNGSAIICLKCQLQTVKLELAMANEKLRFLLRSNNELLKVKHWEHQYALEWISLDINKEDLFINPLTLSNTYFITITFDPNKFGVANNRDEEEIYILCKLSDIYRNDWCFSFYGCFEQHKNGTTHAHLIMHSNYKNDVYKYLKRSFTDNPRNHNCIDIGPAHETKSISYIQKESNKYFKTIAR